MKRTVWQVWALVGLAGAMALSSCACGERLNARNPKLELPAEGGGEREAVDFGTVQVGLTHQVQVRIRNGGTAVLNIDALEAPEPFGATTVLPLTLEPGGEDVLAFTFTPTRPDVDEAAELVLRSNDPERRAVSLRLSGRGVEAVAVVEPTEIDFRDVYVKETGTTAFTVRNAGSHPLELKGAELVSAPSVQLAGASFPQTLAPGASVQVALSFAPTEMLDLTGAAVELSVDEAAGATVRVPLRGRGVLSMPRVCFRFEGEAMEQCSDPASGAPNLQVRLPALCDRTLFPPGSGASACKPEESQRRGLLYVRNEGNVPLAYTAQFTPFPYEGKDRCDGGLSAQSDFTFSNAPTLADGGMPAQYLEPAAKLPGDPNAPKPWESTPVALTYTARSRCRDEATDLARVVFTRQGEPLSRTPSLWMFTIDGTSKLPHAVPSDWNCGAPGSPQSVPCAAPFFGVNNSGSAPLKVTKVELWEEVMLPDGGSPDAGGPRGGYFFPCDPANPYSDCARFAWKAVDGGDPNQGAPHQLSAATDPAQPTQKPLGVMVFGPSGAGDCLNGPQACPNRLYRVYAKVYTDDPYQPEVITQIQGVADAPR